MSGKVFFRKSNMLSVLIHTRNSAKTVKLALESVQWASEIIVVDMNSTDSTPEICKRYTDNIFQFKDTGFVEPARNFGISKVKQKWVFILDADEELSKGLQKFLTKFDQKEFESEYVAFEFARQNIFWGESLTHTGWWPDYQLRLFKKESVKWSQEIHSKPEISGLSTRLPIDRNLAIIHHNYSTVSEYIDRVNHYSTIEASQSPSLKQTFTPSDIVQAFSDEFTRRFFLWNGYRDGVRGVSLSLLQASSQLLKELKRWEKSKNKDNSYTESESIEAIQILQSSLNYWIADWKTQHSSGLTKIFWKMRRKLKI